MFIRRNIIGMQYYVSVLSGNIYALRHLLRKAIPTEGRYKGILLWSLWNNAFIDTSMYLDNATKCTDIIREVKASLTIRKKKFPIIIRSLCIKVVRKFNRGEQKGSYVRN